MNEPQLPSIEQMKKRSAKITKTVLLIFGGVILLALLVLLGLYFFLPEKQKTPQKEYEFYPVSDANIFENAEYLALDRAVYYCDDPGGYGSTEPITDADRESFDIKVRFIELYINSIISGDRETYPTLFAASYWNTHEIPAFTQQMLYHIRIYGGYGSENLENGVQRVTYRVEYMIHRNNGTFRRDVGSDAIRPQYLDLLVFPDGSIQIGDVRTQFTESR